MSPPAIAIAARQRRKTARLSVKAKEMVAIPQRTSPATTSGIGPKRPARRPETALETRKPPRQTLIRAPASA
jgi:hypothetical protein